MIQQPSTKGAVPFAFPTTRMLLVTQENPASGRSATNHPKAWEEKLVWNKKRPPIRKQIKKFVRSL